MKYHAPTKQFTISAADLERAAMQMRYAIRNIRLSGGLDLRGYDMPGPMSYHEFAECGIIEAAKNLGIDLGAGWAGKLDVSEDI